MVEQPVYHWRTCRPTTRRQMWECSQPVSQSQLHVVTGTVGRRPYKPVQPARVSWAISPVITSHPAVTVCALKDGEEVVNTPRTLSPPQLLTVLRSDVIDDVSTYPYYQGTSQPPSAAYCEFPGHVRISEKCLRDVRPACLPDWVSTLRLGRAPTRW